MRLATTEDYGTFAVSLGFEKLKSTVIKGMDFDHDVDYAFPVPLEEFVKEFLQEEHIYWRDEETYSEEDVRSGEITEYFPEEWENFCKERGILLSS